MQFGLIGVPTNAFGRPDGVARAPGVPRPDRSGTAPAGMRPRAHPRIDLDVLSTHSLAAVDYPPPGGLSWPELEDVVAEAVAVTIYNPDLDPGLAGAPRIVAFISTVARLPADGPR